MEPAYILGAGGAIGALLRYATGTLVGSEQFPFPTLIVNVTGSFLLGLAVFSGLDGNLSLFFAVGFCGSLTTYSSFSVDTIELWDESRKQAILYVVGTSSLSLFAAGMAAAIVHVVSL